MDSHYTTVVLDEAMVSAVAPYINGTQSSPVPVYGNAIVFSSLLIGVTAGSTLYIAYLVSYDGVMYYTVGSNTMTALGHTTAVVTSAGYAFVKCQVSIDAGTAISTHTISFASL